MVLHNNELALEEAERKEREISLTDKEMAKRSILFNPLPDMPVLSSSNSAAKKDMMSKIWTKYKYSYWID